MIRLAASVLLLAAFALPLYWPPAGAPLSVPAPDAGLIERLFPGLPAWWELMRLACLFAGALLFPGARFSPTAESSAPTPASPRAGTPRPALYLTLALWVASYFVDTFTRPLQLAYIAALFLPALVMLRLEGSQEGAAGRTTLSSSTAAVIGVVLVWLLIRVPLTLHAPRIADAVDMSLAFNGLQRMAAPELNVISGGIQAGGITALHLVPQGGGILGWSGIPLTATLLQCIHFAWDAVAAVAIGLVAARTIGSAAGPVAAAALLFSPYMMATPYYLGAVFLGPLFTGALLFLYLRVRDRASVSTLLLMAAIAGIAATHPALAPIAVAVFALALWSSSRVPGSWTAIAIAALLFLITLVPALPRAHDLAGLFQGLAQTRTQWSAMEAGLFGQFATSLGETATRLGRPEAVDVPLGAMLAPFSIPRTAARLWGWNLFDPLATVLAAIGIVVCVFQATRRPAALGLLALLGMALLPGFASSYDRPSLTRMLVLPVPMALLAAVGFDRARRVLAPRLHESLAGATAVVVIAAGGLWLFDVVHPHLLPHSANAIAVGLVQRMQPLDVLLLRHPRWDAEEVELYAREVPRRPLPERPFTGVDTFIDLQPDLILWSPGLEDDLGVASAICGRWPEADLHVFTDAAGRSKLFAARPGASPRVDWPEPPADSGSCGMRLPTEGAAAARTLAAAQQLIDEGRGDEAVDVMLSAARESFVTVALFETLARQFMRRRALDEAEYWAWRAAVPKSGKAQPHLLLAEIRTARGNLDAALESARLGLEIAEQAGDPRLAEEARALIEDLQARRGGA